MNIFPKISIITPSYNQAEFLDRTLRSVHDQNYPNLEHIVIDGGSTDGSVDILRKYSSRLAYWVSEKDHGQANAINKGIRRATGEWIAWQNSDDIYYPGVFEQLAFAASHHERANLIIGNVRLIDRNDRIIREQRYVRPTYRALVAEGMVMTNQAAFWRRSMHAKIGMLDESLRFGFDYDWFLRLTKAGNCEHVNSLWGAFRLHGEAKTTKWANLANDEHKIVHQRQGLKMSRSIALLYTLRRLGLLIAQGNFVYVGKGLYDRIIRHEQRPSGGTLFRQND